MEEHLEPFTTLHASIHHSLLTPFVAAAVLWAALANSVAAAEFTFAALGDIPYTQDEEARFPDLIAELNREKLAFVVHVGDFKSAASACSDELFLQRREWFRLSRQPFVLVPGDNEWIDCGRSWDDARQPLERLHKLRALFFEAGANAGLAPTGLARQSDLATPRHDYPEHWRWEFGGALFITLNAPGPTNNSRDPGEHSRRGAAIADWLTRSFGLARGRELGALVIFMHADPWNAAGYPRRGFGSLLAQLADETHRFAGSVLLVHGDNHRYMVNQPLRHPSAGKRLANFTRVQVFGSPEMNWVRVRVSDEAGRVRFIVTPGS